MARWKNAIAGGGATLGILILGLCAPTYASPASTSPVVVELFTSQGCSSCPPANANLITVSDRPGVLALSFSVTYWDYLGWKDSFARPEFTARQYAYERTLNRGGAFTPQMVVNGETDLVGNEIGELEQAIDGERAAAAKRAAGVFPVLALSATGLDVGAAQAPDGGADVWLVRYDPDTVQVPVAHGENGGRTLPHKDVVHQLTRLGGWTGGEAHFDLPAATDGMKTAILVQSSLTNQILAAATN